jgi:hypothetical protein
VIAVFTKFDQFERDAKYKLQDKGLDQGTNLSHEVERLFRKYYQAFLEGSQMFVRLGSKDLALRTKLCCAHPCLSGMHKPGEDCTALINITADALSPDVVALMLVAAQKSGLELSIRQAVKRYAFGNVRRE